MANYVKSERLGEWYSEDRSEMTPRRRKFIHEQRKKAELYGPKLPYDFGIFTKKYNTGKRDIGVQCECGHHIFVTKMTCFVECRNCKSLVRVK